MKDFGAMSRQQPSRNAHSAPQNGRRSVKWEYYGGALAASANVTVQERKP